MRVVHVYHDFHPVRGGIEDYLADLTSAQAAEGIETVVLCANHGPRTTSECWRGVRVVRVASFGRWFTPFCPGWPFWLQRLKPDIVHLHLPCPLGEWSVALNGASRLVVSLHNEYVRPRVAVRLHLPMHRAVLARAAAIIASSADYAQTSAVLHAVQGKVHVVPYGIDTGRYTPCSCGRRSMEGAPIVFAGRLCYYKGLEVLLDAARWVGGRVTIVGDGPWARRLRAQAQRLGLRGRVHFTGAISEAALIARMHSSRIFVFPSTERSEAFGIAALKAMACGLPVVSSDLPGVSWLNRHGETGLTAPVRDARLLSAALNRLSADEPLRLRLSANARARAEEFSGERMVRATGQVYEAVA